MVPKASMDEDRESATGVRNIRAARGASPIEAISREAACSKGAADGELGACARRPIRLHYRSSGR